MPSTKGQSDLLGHLRLLGWHDGKSKMKGKGRSRARTALYTDGTTQQIGKALSYSQAQTGSLLLPVMLRILLFKGLKQAFLKGCAHANTVILNDKIRFQPFCSQNHIFHSQGHIATIGREFHSIREEIEKYLIIFQFIR